MVRRLSLLKSWVEGSRKSDEPPRFKYSTEMNSLADAFANMSVHLRNKHEELEQEDAKLRELNKELGKRLRNANRHRKNCANTPIGLVDLYNNAPCGYHSLNENGVYVQVNDTELSCGRTRKEVVDRLHLEVCLGTRTACFL